MAEYITATAVENRLTRLGYKFAVDRDDVDGVADANEVSRYVTPAIKYAGRLIDQAVSPFMEPTDARAASNGWLQDRCLDIACVRVLQLGGRKVPADWKEDKDDAMERLRDVEDQKLRIPDLTYSRPGYGAGQSTRAMRIYKVR